MSWYGNPRLAVDIEIIYWDGSAERICSDETWKLSDGDITFNCLYDGIKRDYRKTQDGWSSCGFDDSAWTFAKETEPPCDIFVNNKIPLVKECRKIKPVSVHKIDGNRYLYDFGENVSGYAKLRVRGARGSIITIEHAEFTDKNGNLDTFTNRNALNTDEYILSGDESEICEPKFVYHGFRYIRVTLSDENTGILSAEAFFVHNDLKITGGFRCDNEELNRLHNVILRTQLSCTVGQPIDCPQRDERLGWLGDAAVTAQVSMYNFDAGSFYEQWLDDIRIGQKQDGNIPFIAYKNNFKSNLYNPDYSASYVLIVWYHYMHYGKKEVLSRHYDSIKLYTQYLKENSENYVLKTSSYGDWLSLVDGWKRGDPECSNTIYFYYIVRIAQKIAAVLSLNDDEAYYSYMSKAMKSAILDRFYDKSLKRFGDGTQFSSAFALLSGIIPDEDANDVLKALAYDIEVTNNCHLTTGIFGTKYLMDVLTDMGREELAYRLMVQKNCPSFLDMINGRTTLPERWDKGGSGNHCIFGSVDYSLYRVLCGIRIDFSKEISIVIKPYVPKDMSFVYGHVQTPMGVIVSEWNKEGGTIIFKISVPQNMIAEFVLDERNVEREVFIDNTKTDLKSIRLTGGTHIIKGFLK